MSPLSCPDVEELAPELALGTLPGDQRSAVLAHLDGCTDCRRLLNNGRAHAAFARAACFRRRVSGATRL